MTSKSQSWQQGKQKSKKKAVLREMKASELDPDRLI